jgi:large subunit ribosomal protein L32e
MRFLRRNTKLHLRIGKRKKSKQKWRRPKGRDNKIRESKKGKSPLVSIGYKTKNEKKRTITIYNLKDLELAKGYERVILAKIGKKKKIGIIKKAIEMKINFDNINEKRFLKKNEPK